MGELKCCLGSLFVLKVKNARFLNPWVSCSNVIESCGFKFECNARSESILGAYAFVCGCCRKKGRSRCLSEMVRWITKVGLPTDARRGVGEARLTFFVNYILLFKPHLSSD